MLKLITIYFNTLFYKGYHRYLYIFFLLYMKQVDTNSCTDVLQSPIQTNRMVQAGHTDLSLPIVKTLSGNGLDLLSPLYSGNILGSMSPGSCEVCCPDCAHGSPETQTQEYFLSIMVMINLIHFQTMFKADFFYQLHNFE